MHYKYYEVLSYDEEIRESVKRTGRTATAAHCALHHTGEPSTFRETFKVANVS